MSEVKGADALVRALKKLADRAPHVANKAVKDVALDVLGRAVSDAPVETGHLRESGWAELNGSRFAEGNKQGGISVTGTGAAHGGGEATAMVGFNATTPDGQHSYALIQHEELGFNHPLGGKAKYLEGAVQEVATGLRARIANDFTKLVQDLEG